MGIFNQAAGKNKFTNALICPICAQSPEYEVRKQSWKLTGYLRPTCARYICKKCQTPIRYDFTNRLSPQESAMRGLIT